VQLHCKLYRLPAKNYFHSQLHRDEVAGDPLGPAHPELTFSQTYCEAPVGRRPIVWGEPWDDTATDQPASIARHVDTPPHVPDAAKRQPSATSRSQFAANTHYERTSADDRSPTMRRSEIPTRGRPALCRSGDTGHVVRPPRPRPQPRTPRRRVEFRRHSCDPPRSQRAMDLEADRTHAVLQQGAGR